MYFHYFLIEIWHQQFPDVTLHFLLILIKWDLPYSILLFNNFRGCRVPVLTTILSSKAWNNLFRTQPFRSEKKTENVGFQFINYSKRLLFLLLFFRRLFQTNLQFHLQLVSVCSIVSFVLFAIHIPTKVHWIS